MPEKQPIMDFYEARDDGVAVSSAGPYAPCSGQITMPGLPATHHSKIFKGWMMLFLMPNEQ